MKKFLAKLALREQQFIKIGIPIAILLIFYLFIWSPFTTQIQNLQQTVNNEQDTSLWMEGAIQQINSLRTKGILQQQQSNGSNLTLVDESLKNSPITSRVAELSQANNNQVTVKFSHVGFDVLITWLNQLWQRNGIQATQFSATATQTSGLVDAQVTLVSN